MISRLRLHCGGPLRFDVMRINKCNIALQRVARNGNASSSVPSPSGAVNDTAGGLVIGGEKPRERGWVSVTAVHHRSSSARSFTAAGENRDGRQRLSCTPPSSRGAVNDTAGGLVIGGKKPRKRGWVGNQLPISLRKIPEHGVIQEEDRPMGKAWYRLFYHVTWSTYRREPIITPEIETVLYPYLELRQRNTAGLSTAAMGLRIMCTPQ